MWRMLAFRDDKPLPWSKFTADVCEEFLRWCLKHGANGKPVGTEEVNRTYRFMLVAISKAAAAAGLIRRRLHLDPVAPLKRRQKPKASTNGHAAASLLAQPPRLPKRRGRKPRWTHFKAWLPGHLRENPGIKPAEVGSDYRRDFPKSPMPNKDVRRTMISEARASL
jgi:hypothetical protein